MPITDALTRKSQHVSPFSNVVAEKGGKLFLNAAKTNYFTMNDDDDSIEIYIGGVKVADITANGLEVAA